MTSRIDQIGQNGNGGLAYNPKDVAFTEDCKRELSHPEQPLDMVHHGFIAVKKESGHDPLSDLTISIKPTMHSQLKQSRYQDSAGDDWIDECARTLTPEEFRGAMKFTIGKYIRRAGKKDDLIKEIGKIEDYARRWGDYERGLLEE